MISIPFEKDVPDRSENKNDEIDVKSVIGFQQIVHLILIEMNCKRKELIW